MANQPTGALGMIVGTNSPAFGATCKYHNICGHVLQLDHIFRLRKTIVLAGKLIVILLFPSSISSHNFLFLQMITGTRMLSLPRGWLMALSVVLWVALTWTTRQSWTILTVVWSRLLNYLATPMPSRKKNFCQEEWSMSCCSHRHVRSWRRTCPQVPREARQWRRIELK